MTNARTINLLSRRHKREAEKWTKKEQENKTT